MVNLCRYECRYDAARVMVGEADELALGFNFELFTHTTTFFGQKVILLGLYNGQKLEKEPEADVVMYTRWGCAR